MPTALPKVPTQDGSLYRATVREAAAQGGLLMGKLVNAARQSLQTREAAAREKRVRDALAQSAKQLRNWESELCQRYPVVLLEAFASPDAVKPSSIVSIANVHFDELELMNETQLQTSVVMARAQQVVLMTAEVSLAEFNTLICSTLGLGAVEADRNPLRPQVYIDALKSVVEQSNVALEIQLDWLNSMSQCLGNELSDLYARLTRSLRNQGVVPAGYAVAQTQKVVGVGRGVAQSLMPDTPTDVKPPPATTGAPRTGANSSPVPASRVHDTDSSGLLTLDKLRRLLSGELVGDDSQSPSESFSERFEREFESAALRRLLSGGEDAPQSPIESFSERFEREFESESQSSPLPMTDFDSTVPAALEALNEMQQVDKVVQRMKQHHGKPVAPPRVGDTSLEAERAQLRMGAKGVAQALSLEVVALVVDNIANDARLMEPVQQLIRQLEPPLARLALVDPRIFTFKQHPARLLVQEVTHRSMAYASVQAEGFADFLSELEKAIAPLLHAPIESAEPFELVLTGLRDTWNQAAITSERNREQAMKALQQAEQRNMLAEKIAREVDSHPEAAHVPVVVINFLCGPWAQVVAQARIDGGRGSEAADKYQALISALLWSTHPELTKKNTTKLTRVVPRLLSTLREGLNTVNYPATRTGVFLEALMGLHEQAFRANKTDIDEVQRKVAVPLPKSSMDARQHLLDDGDPWVAPEEALASNFMELPDLEPAAAPNEQAGSAGRPDGRLAGEAIIGAVAAPIAVHEFSLGSWVELMVEGRWVRTQLTWASQHGTLFLFTSVFGTTQSMTRRSRDKLLASGSLRVISGEPVVDGALDAVAKLAMRNSVNRAQ